LQVNGQTFVLYAPGFVIQPGETFTAVLPPEKGVGEEEENAAGSSHGQGASPTSPASSMTASASGSSDGLEYSAGANPFARPSGNYRDAQASLNWE